MNNTALTKTSEFSKYKNNSSSGSGQGSSTPAVSGAPATHDGEGMVGWKARHLMGLARTRVKGWLGEQSKLTGNSIGTRAVDLVMLRRWAYTGLTKMLPCRA
ncbi:hypothetical protein TIFTF001_038922 [Ficus carica]|uniref:Uncharacterized protein n=1 Tax=Ficus carica TaxID=3494 RepID=A0AA88JFA6_FICCA|nr:hypothetical protein TIFTF001_038922 [Ficus carica]